MALTALELIIVILATHRAARVIATDDISLEAREYLAVWASNGGKVRAKLVEGIECPFCAGWWLSVVAYAAACVALDRVHDVSIFAHMVEAWGVMGGQAVLAAFDHRMMSE